MKKRDRVIALFKVANRELGAIEIAEICGIWMLGSVYPILWTLETEGLITSRFLDGSYPRRCRFRWKETS
jgi:hypothetical protein